jgi:hypothetical protein
VVRPYIERDPLPIDMLRAGAEPAPLDTFRTCGVADNGRGSAKGNLGGTAGNEGVLGPMVAIFAVDFGRRTGKLMVLAANWYH